ncbi:Calcium-binding EGF domain [Seminavis robusta]|uniref:Calcium-binding EGF domain n=1 Tax=Seminavis robusta TaxID=568900 RepID=A0A9N8H528_9STRA|nr:Calcium-binding EGF domain [Seminavis robusta]|eukprot:Sro101_g051810.1 Calcium-binding EGF domain (1288) ;mRNA; f:111068-114931
MPTTAVPTVTPGNPSAAPTSAAPSSSPTTALPTTAVPTVTPGNPSAAPTSAAPSLRPTTAQPTTSVPTVTPGNPSAAPTTSNPATTGTTSTVNPSSSTLAPSGNTMLPIAAGPLTSSPTEASGTYQPTHLLNGGFTSSPTSLVSPRPTQTSTSPATMSSPALQTGNPSTLTPTTNSPTTPQTAKPSSPPPTTPAPTSTPKPTLSPTTTNTQVVKAYNAWDVSNSIGLTTSMLTSGPDRQGLHNAYKQFVNEVVGELTTNRRRLKLSEHRRRLVSYDPSSALVYKVTDTPCPPSAVEKSKCHTVHGRFNLHVPPEEDANEVYAAYVNATQAAIEEGRLQRKLEKVDPGSAFFVERPSDPEVALSSVSSRAIVDPDLQTNNEESSSNGIGLLGIILIAAGCAAVLVIIIAVSTIVPNKERKKPDKNKKKSEDKPPATEVSETDLSTAVVTETSSDESHREEVEELVRKNCPDHLDDVDALLRQFSGREELLILTLQNMAQEDDLHLAESNDYDVSSNHECNQDSQSLSGELEEAEGFRRAKDTDSSQVLRILPGGLEAATDDAKDEAATSEVSKSLECSTSGLHDRDNRIVSDADSFIFDAPKDGGSHSSTDKCSSTVPDSGLIEGENVQRAAVNDDTHEDAFIAECIAADEKTQETMDSEDDKHEDTREKPRCGDPDNLSAGSESCSSENSSNRKYWLQDANGAWIEVDGPEDIDESESEIEISEGDPSASNWFQRGKQMLEDFIYEDVSINDDESIKDDESSHYDDSTCFEPSNNEAKEGGVNVSGQESLAKIESSSNAQGTAALEDDNRKSADASSYETSVALLVAIEEDKDEEDSQRNHDVGSDGDMQHPTNHTTDQPPKLEEGIGNELTPQLHEEEGLQNPQSMETSAFAINESSDDRLDDEGWVLDLKERHGEALQRVHDSETGSSNQDTEINDSNEVVGVADATSATAIDDEEECQEKIDAAEQQVDAASGTVDLEKQLDDVARSEHPEAGRSTIETVEPKDPAEAEPETMQNNQKETDDHDAHVENNVAHEFEPDTEKGRGTDEPNSCNMSEEIFDQVEDEPEQADNWDAVDQDEHQITEIEPEQVQVVDYSDCDNDNDNDNVNSMKESNGQEDPDVVGTGESSESKHEEVQVIAESEVYANRDEEPKDQAVEHEKDEELKGGAEEPENTNSSGEVTNVPKHTTGEPVIGQTKVETDANEDMKDQEADDREDMAVTAEPHVTGAPESSDQDPSASGSAPLTGETSLAEEMPQREDSSSASDEGSVSSGSDQSDQSDASEGH